MLYRFERKLVNRVRARQEHRTRGKTKPMRVRPALFTLRNIFNFILHAAQKMQLC